MKKSLLVMMFVALGFLFAGASQSYAQGRPMTGSYKEIDKNKEEDAQRWAEAEAAAEFAVTEQAKKQDTTIKLVSVEHAESQVVAGTKYRLCMKVEVEDKESNTDVVQEVKVEVFRSLQKEYKLMSWTEEDCGEGESQ